MAEPDVKVELAADLERARARLAGNFGALRQDLDVAAIVKHSFHKNKAAYIGGATFLGLVLSSVSGLGKGRASKGKAAKGSKEVKAVEKAGLWILLLQFLLKALSPAISSLIETQVTGFIKTKSRGPG
jgi:hypothetical protein